MCVWVLLFHSRDRALWVSAAPHEMASRGITCLTSRLDVRCVWRFEANCGCALCATPSRKTDTSGGVETAAAKLRGTIHAVLRTHGKFPFPSTSSRQHDVSVCATWKWSQHNKKVRRLPFCKDSLLRDPIFAMAHPLYFNGHFYEPHT